MNFTEFQPYLLPALIAGFFAWRFLKFRMLRNRLPALIKQGAVIVDVRSQQEFAAGSAEGSINIPLDSLGQNLGRLNRERPVILCCASGTRSGIGAMTLKRNGFAQVFNGGPWTNLRGLRASAGSP